MAQNQTANTTQPLLPYIFPPTNQFDGNDGSWSTFYINIGDSGSIDGQNFRVLISTSSPLTMVPLTANWCNDADCAKKRGVEPYQSRQNTGFDSSSSKSWQLSGLYNLPLLGLDYYPDNNPNGSWGFDTVGLGVDSTTTPQLINQFVVGTVTEDFFMGSFGLAANPVDFGGGAHTTFLKAFNDSNQIPSLSYGYTAGASYRTNNGKGLAGSLIFGGYDQSRFTTQNITTSMTGDNSTLQVGVQSIEVTPDSTGGTNVYSMMNGTTPFPAIIDSTLPYLWLPPAICDKFADVFRLTYDNTTMLYTVSDSSHNYNTDQNATIAFKIGAGTTLSNTFASIKLPYAAFDLEASSPIYSNATKYFPIKRASNNQFVLGRAFLQEAYLVVDYERNSFTVAPTNYTDPMPSSHIVTIHSKTYVTPTPSPTHKSSSGLSSGAIAGIAVGIVLLVLLLIAGGFFFWRRKKNQDKPKELEANSDLDTTLAGDQVKKRRVSELDSNASTRGSVTGYYGNDRERKEPFPPISEGTHEMESPPAVHELESPPSESAASPRSMRSEVTDYFDRSTRRRGGTRDSSAAGKASPAPVAELPGDDGMFQVQGQHFEPVGGHSRGPSGNSVGSGTLTAVSDPTTDQLEAWALGEDSATDRDAPSEVSEISRASRSLSRSGFRSLSRGERRSLSRTAEEPVTPVTETAEEHQH